jgi:hypothetical protein
MSSWPRILGVDDEAQITRVLRTSLFAQELGSRSITLNNDRIRSETAEDAPSEHHRRHHASTPTGIDRLRETNHDMHLRAGPKMQPR